MKEIALLGPTASGKTKLSLELAENFNAVILSLDSLSLYKEIDIASAKPSKEQRGNIIHFGIDEIYPYQHFNSADFISLYKRAKNFALSKDMNIIIVGGTSFYLKSILDGLSPKPKVDDATLKKIKAYDKKEAFELISIKDPKFAKKISPNDNYRIEKWLEIYLSTSIIPTKYFEKYQKRALKNCIKIYEIFIEKDILKNRVIKRTNQMIKDGLIDEVFYLEKKYTRSVKPLKAIGIKEGLEYLDGKIDLNELKEKISRSTLHLAKRQMTFNKSQFKNIIRGKKEIIYEEIKKYMKS